MNNEWGSFCCRCGTALSGPFPRICTNNHYTFASPLGVGVTLQPVIAADKTGLLIGYRNINPFKGQPALPGGFAENNETTKQAATRELGEETNIESDAASTTYFDEVSIRPGNDPRSQTLYFYVAKPITMDDINFDFSNGETQSLAVVFLRNGSELVDQHDAPTTLCFSEHHKIAVKYLQTLAP